jgi:hypothetical protein
MSLWSNTLAKKLDMLIQGSAVPSPMTPPSYAQTPIDRYEHAAIALEEYAVSTPYTGPSNGSPAYCGWPVMELLKNVPPAMRSSVAAAFYKRNVSVMGQASASGKVGGTLPPLRQAATPKQYSLENMMAMRMRWGQMGGEWAVGFAHMAMHEAGDVVHVWIISHDGQSVVLQDEAGLFPSDTLITKIRLMQQESKT